MVMCTTIGECEVSIFPSKRQVRPTLFGFQILSNLKSKFASRIGKVGE